MLQLVGLDERGVVRCRPTVQGVTQQVACSRGAYQSPRVYREYLLETHT